MNSTASFLQWNKPSQIDAVLNQAESHTYLLKKSHDYLIKNPKMIYLFKIDLNWLCLLLLE
jgi:hypothetical protein